MSAPAIAVENLTVHFGEIAAVAEVDFAVAEGESFALVGESGSGKTTVLRVLAGLLTNWTGAARVAGHDLKRQRQRSLARIVQLVFQDPYASLHPLHTVDRVLGEVCAIHRLDDANGRIDRVLKDVGLGPEFRFRFPHQLSGGQRQRVAVARALILEPKIMLLDEPTSALDVSVQAEILNLLRRLRAARGLTMLLVTHNLAVVSNLCERLAVMQRGRIVETMDAAALRRGVAATRYTGQLIAASRGYDRANAADIEVGVGV